MFSAIPATRTRSWSTRTLGMTDFRFKNRRVFQCGRQLVGSTNRARCVRLAVFPKFSWPWMECRI